MINIDDRLIKEDLKKIGTDSLGVLLCITTHIDKKNKAFPSIPRLQQMTGLSKKRVQKSIKELEEHKFLERDQENKAGKFGKVIYTITTNYLSIFLGLYGEKLEEKPSNTNGSYRDACLGDAGNRVTGLRPTENDPLSINEELSINEKEVSLLKDEIEQLKAELEKYKPKELKYEKEIVEVINFLNEKTGKNFKAESIKTIGLINGRLNEGYTIDDFKNVITNKTNQWLNDKVTNTWLRPSTLFNVNKFEDYVNENPPEPIEIEEDDFELNEAQEIVYQDWIEEGKQKYPALVNSETTYLTRRQLADLMTYANKPTTRVEFTIKGFKLFMKKCFKELNDFKYKRDAYVSAYNYIIDEAKKEINR